MANKKKILLLMPNDGTGYNHTKERLNDAGFEAMHISDDVRAREYLKTNTPDAIFVDHAFELDPEHIKNERDNYFYSSDRNALFGGLLVAHQIRDAGFKGAIEIFANTPGLAKLCNNIIKDMRYENPIEVHDIKADAEKYVKTAEELFGKQTVWQGAVKKDGPASGGQGSGYRK